jgi:hypothetical protein
LLVDCFDHAVLESSTGLTLQIPPQHTLTHTRSSSDQLDLKGTDRFNLRFIKRLKMA